MRKTILYIKPWDVSFVRKDEEILSKYYNVKSYCFPSTKGAKGVKGMLWSVWWLLINLRKADMIYVWFAGIHSLLPGLISKIFGKKLIIVLGGIDVNTYPELGYGFMLHPLTRFSVKVSCRLADKLLPVTNFLKDQLVKNVSDRYGDKTEVVYNCFWGEIFTVDSEINRKRQVITACSTRKILTLKVKSIDVYIEAARLLPDISFLIVGSQGEAYDYLKKNSPDNVEVISFLPLEQLSTLYNESKVYCQASRVESFGVALVEGIASGCFPVANSAGGLPEVLEGTEGILINELKPKVLAEAITKAIDIPEGSYSDMRDYIISKFSPLRREQALVRIIDSYL